MGDEEKRLLLHLLTAIAATEDRLNEMQKTTEHEALARRLRFAVLEAELSFFDSPALNSGKEPETK
jgi:hypothetical protein